MYFGFGGTFGIRSSRVALGVVGVVSPRGSVGTVGTGGTFPCEGWSGNECGGVGVNPGVVDGSESASELHERSCSAFPECVVLNWTWQRMRENGADTWEQA